MSYNNTEWIAKRERELQSFWKKRRPPEEIREKLDLGYTFEKGTVEIFEIRPVWKGNGEKMKSSFAKAKYVQSRRKWKVYWMRASGKWELLDPQKEVYQLSEFLRLVDDDPYGCFWG